MTRRTAILIAMFLLTPFAVIAVPVGLRVWRLISYSRQQRVGAELVESLRGRRPDNVSPKRWDDATGWAVTAYHNVCFSEAHVPFDELVRFISDVRHKLEGNVGLDSIDWIGKRLAETGPHGRRYYNTFEPLYRSIVDDARAN